MDSLGLFNKELFLDVLFDRLPPTDALQGLVTVVFDEVTEEGYEEERLVIARYGTEGMLKEEPEKIRYWYARMYHCSCYSFEEILPRDLDAFSLTLGELEALATAWAKGDFLDLEAAHFIASGALK